jgi:hypothetical protein
MRRLPRIMIVSRCVRRPGYEESVGLVIKLLPVLRFADDRPLYKFSNAVERKSSSARWTDRLGGNRS